MDVAKAYDTMDDLLKAKYPKYKGYDLLDDEQKHKIEKGKYKPACYVAITEGVFNMIVTEFLFAAVDRETESEFILFFGPEIFGPEGIRRYL